MAFGRIGAIGDDHPGVIGIPHTDDWQTRRLDAHIDGETPTDPWSRTTHAPFYLSARELLERALKAPPRDSKPTASGFASWVHSLYSDDRDRHAMHRAKQSEDEILDAKRDWTSYSEFRHFRLSNWKQIHCGMGVPGLDDVQKQFEVPDLQLHGVPLRAIPDLVFQQQDTGQVAIIEVKFSMAKIPTNLWPNVWAQLWAYSRIPEFSTAPSISCIGEVWGENAGGWARDELTSSVYLRSAVRRDPRQPAFERFFGEMFRIFNGTSHLLETAG